MKLPGDVHAAAEPCRIYCKRVGKLSNRVTYDQTGDCQDTAFEPIISANAGKGTDEAGHGDGASIRAFGALNRYKKAFFLLSLPYIIAFN